LAKWPVAAAGPFPRFRISMNLNRGALAKSGLHKPAALAKAADA